MQTITQSFFDNSVFKWRSTQSVINVGVIDLTAKSDIDDFSVDGYRLFYENQLKDDIRTAPLYGTLEENEYFLDGSVTVLPDTLTDEQIGWWTEMSDANGDMDNSITVEFNNHHSSIGLTFYYDTFSYPLETEVKWFNGGLEIKSGTYQLTGSVQVVEEPVNGYDKIIVTYKKAKPLAYVKLLEISYGKTMTLTGEQLQGATLTEHLSLMSNTLSPDELSFNIINYDGQYDILNPQDLLTYFKKGQKCEVSSGVFNEDTDEYEYMDMGVFYVDSTSSLDGIITVTGYGILNQLNEEDFYSEWFSNKTVEYIASKILDGYSYYVHPNVKDIILTGYIPLGSKKEALKTLAISCNAIVKEGRDGRIYIYQPTEELSTNQIIADDTKYERYGYAGMMEAGIFPLQVTVEPEPYVLTITRSQRLSQIKAEMIGYYHKVEIDYNNYIQNGTSETLFDGDITTDGEGVAVIKYNSPVYDLSGTESGFSLFHYADCTVVVGDDINTTYHVTITGKKYGIENAVISATNQLSDNTYDEARLVMTLATNNTLLNDTQAKLCALWYLSQLQKRKDISFDWWSVCGVEAGDFAKLITSYDEEVTMQISEIKYNLVNLIANVKGVL